ncbi:MAG: F0F1 ATP synthase subunit gamma [Paraclostridium sp.]
MAGAGIKEIKNRIGSVQSTKQVTKAMELVSSSKMRKAKDRALASRPYFNTMYNTVKDIATNTRGVRDPFLKQREVKNKCYIVIAGDRGLAGGYNSNIFKLTTAHMDGKRKVMTVGKKATEFSKGYNIVAAEESVENVIMIEH